MDLPSGWELHALYLRMRDSVKATKRKRNKADLRAEGKGAKFKVVDGTDVTEWLVDTLSENRALSKDGVQTLCCKMIEHGLLYHVRMADESENQSSFSTKFVENACYSFDDSAANALMISLLLCKSPANDLMDVAQRMQSIRLEC